MQINSDDRKESAKLALGENISPGLYDDMSTDVGIGNGLPISAEPQSTVEKQDNFTIITNTAEDANNTNLDKEHSAAATEV